MSFNHFLLELLQITDVLALRISHAKTQICYKMENNLIKSILQHLQLHNH